MSIGYAYIMLLQLVGITIQTLIPLAWVLVAYHAAKSLRKFVEK